MPLALASASVRPHQASSGSVKTTAGMMTPAEVLDSPTMVSTAMRPSLVALWASKTPPGDVADGEDGGVGGFLAVVDFDEAAVVLLDFGVFQTEVAAARHAANGNQDAVEKFFLWRFIGAFGDDEDFFPLGGHLGRPWF